MTYRLALTLTIPMLLLGGAAPPVQNEAPALAPSQGCKVNVAELRGICSAVHERTRVYGGTDRYLYERLIRRAACAPTDSEEDLSRIREVWRNNQKHFQCSTPNFDVSEGSILKYGIATRSYSIAYRAVQWKLDLNIVDRSDNRTVLDYIQGQKLANKGNDSIPQLDDVYELYRRNGAKHRSELP